MIKEKLFFNFKNTEGWAKYKSLTSGQILTNCIKGINIEEEGRIWLKKFTNILHQSFKKSRKTQKYKFNIIHQLMLKNLS